jgi:predicted lipid-binding transport protein (Tim44 family)
MRRSARLLTASAVIALALAPAFAHARPGGGGSFGSRGGRTYVPPPPTNTAPGTARPMQRSAEPQQARPGATYGNPAPVRPPFGTGPSASRFGGGFFPGLMGGLIGAGLGGLLFGHGLFGGFTGFGSLIGLMLQMLLLYFVFRWVMGLVRGRMGAPAYAGAGPAGMARTMPDAMHPARPPYAGGVPAAAAAAVTLTRTDLETFEGILRQVNHAWSTQDESAMRGVATAEMVGHFGEDLADLARRGLRNETADLKLEQGDIAESWREGNRDYATVAMRFSMRDMTRRLDDGRVVEGDADRRTEATELWTFVRTPGGPWLLSAVQQTR